VALVLVACVSLLFICIGDVNFLAPIVTMPFLVTYIAVDYAYFSLAMSYDLRSSRSRQYRRIDCQENEKANGKQSLDKYGSMSESGNIIETGR